MNFGSGCAMKPSYSIGAKNGILEQKHMHQLGQAIWLYLWFLDKQPKDTDKVLGGRPITYEMFAEVFPDIPRRTFFRWLDRIKAGGYIEMLRTPRGSVVTIIKPKKWDKSDVPKTAHQSESDVPKMALDVPKTAHPSAKNGTSNIRETIKKQKETVNTSNEVSAVSRGKPEINEVFEYWEQVIGFGIESQVKMNRYAAGNLIKKYGVDGVKKLIDGVNLAHSDRYAPSISDFRGLQADLNRLLVWGKKKQNVVVPKEQTAWRAKK